jgi:hypothetical protein
MLTAVEENGSQADPAPNSYVEVGMPRSCDIKLHFPKSYR